MSIYCNRKIGKKLKISLRIIDSGNVPPPLSVPPKYDEIMPSAIKSKTIEVEFPPKYGKIPPKAA